MTFWAAASFLARVLALLAITVMPARAQASSREVALLNYANIALGVVVLALLVFVAAGIVAEVISRVKKHSAWIREMDHDLHDLMSRSHRRHR